MSTSPVDAEPTAPSAPPKKGVSPVAAVGFLLKALRHHWRLTVIPLLVGPALGVAGAKLGGKQTWESTGVMLYTPPPVPEAQKGLYTPPDLSTLVTLLKSPDLLAGLQEEFDLPVPTALLDKLFKVTAPRNLQAITITFGWADPDVGARMTNRLMERFVDQTRDQRRRKMGGYIDDYDARLKDCDARHTRAVTALQEYLRKHNLYDLQAEAEAVRREVDLIQTARANNLRDEVSTTAQKERVAKELSDLKKKDTEDAAADKQFEAAMDSVADNRRRQDRLRELIDDDKKRQELLAELTAKRRDYERVGALKERGATGQSEVDAVAKEMEILTAKLNDSAQVKAWKAELQKIDEVVVPKGPNKNQSSPIIQQTLFRQLELDLRLVGIQRELFEGERALAGLHKRQGDIQAAVRQSEGLQKEIEAADADRTKLAEQAALFRRLRDGKASEFTIVTPARPGPFPASSNRKLFVIAGVFLSGLVAVGRVGRAEWRATYHGGKRAAARAKLDTLGAVGPDDVVGHRLAVGRLRTWRPDYGATALFVGDGAADPLPWAIRLGRRLAARDERVLVIDARVGELAPPAANGLPGLGNYLCFQADDPDDYLVSDESAGLEVLPAGDAPTLDVLASHRMAELLAGAKARYSVVFLVGPDVGRADGVDVLARYADGLVAVLSREAAAGRVGPLLAELDARFGGLLRGLVVEPGVAVADDDFKPVPRRRWRLPIGPGWGGRRALGPAAVSE